jgi:hypothetical protein
MGSAGAIILVLACGRQGHPLVHSSIWTSADCSPAAPASSPRGASSLGRTTPLPTVASAAPSPSKVHA